jgi:hypothetical protein
MSKVLSASDAVARLLAGQDPSPIGWRRAREMADEIIERFATHPTEVVSTRTLEERAEPRPCAGCGAEIRPGQAYVVGGPLHIGCFDSSAE